MIITILLIVIFVIAVVAVLYAIAERENQTSSDLERFYYTQEPFTPEQLDAQNERAMDREIVAQERRYQALKRRAERSTRKPRKVRSDKGVSRKPYKEGL